MMLKNVEDILSSIARWLHLSARMYFPRKLTSLGKASLAEIAAERTNTSPKWNKSEIKRNNNGRDKLSIARAAETSYDHF